MTVSDSMTRLLALTSDSGKYTFYHHILSRYGFRTLYRLHNPMLETAQRIKLRRFLTLRMLDPPRSKYY